ncbi:MAG: sporulation protein YqfD [Oscillospiraceae bacterium]|nr:sporulation protein YqfD [Oscillospiraceae bacterium]
MGKKVKGLRFGYVTFSGIGGYHEEMISELLENGIAVRNIELADGGLSGAVSPLDYYRVSEIARRNGVRLRAGERRGVFFTLSKYRTRAGLCFGFIIFMMFISLWQTSVHAITIEGNAPRTQIMRILEECNIKLGASNDSLELSKAEHRIMAEVENCAWTDVSCEGFRVKVRVELGIEKPEMEDDTPRNIVAARPAMIVRQTAKKGASVVNNGSGVNTGDLLVSGTVPDGGGHIMIVRAEAEIIGEWTQTEEFFVPYSETISIANVERKTFKYLVYGDDEYPLFVGKAGAENSLYTEETSVVRFFGGNTAFKVKTGIYTAYTSQNITRSPDDALSELQKQKQRYEENFFSEYKITNAEERFYPQNDGIRLIVDYTLQGDIAKPVPIELGDMTMPEPPETSEASEPQPDN